MPISLLKKLLGKPQRVNIRLYKPRFLQEPQKKIEIVSAWKGLELIIPDILKRFNVEGNRAIEFGVEFGYSTVILSNYFKEVVGVDTFQGDEHTHHKGDHYDQTKKRLSEFENIHLCKARYQEWIEQDNSQYDFAHVDIIHTYEDTFKCGLWASQHSKCTIFHDTESFLEVRKAVHDIAKQTGKKAYNFPKHKGLGIIV